MVVVLRGAVCSSVGGIMVSIAAFQAVDPGSIPGRRSFLFCLFCPCGLLPACLLLPMDYLFNGLIYFSYRHRHFDYSCESFFHAINKALGCITVNVFLYWCVSRRGGRVVKALDC